MNLPVTAIPIRGLRLVFISDDTDIAAYWIGKEAANLLIYDVLF